MAGSTRETDELTIQHANFGPDEGWSGLDKRQVEKGLATALPWTDAERAMSPSREQEPVWFNRINNALGPSRRSSLHGKGHVQERGNGRHTIAEQGRRFITDDDFTIDDLINGR